MALKMLQQTEKPASAVKYTIAIAAGKGGVGKSSVTVNLGLALQRLGYSVGIMDADIYGPSIRKMLPEDEMPTQKGPMIIPAVCRGIRLISMAYFRPQKEATAVRAPIANGIIAQFIKNVAWGELDYLLIDFPPGTGDIQLSLSQQAHLTGAIMVTTPQDVAVIDVRKAMNLFEHVKVPVIGIVENMSYYYHEKTDEKIYLFGKGGGAKLAEEKNVAFLGGIPIDPNICLSGDRGRSLFLDAPQSVSAKVFEEIARRLVGDMSFAKEQNQNHLESFELVWKEMPTE
jgi:ATP-binding protein involved in chromosome partitioning